MELSKTDDILLMGNDETKSAADLEGMAKRIRQHPFFADFPEQFIPTLAANAMPVEFDKGQIIFDVGDLANRFYLIEKGKIRLEAEGPDGQNVVLQVLEPGQVLGWSWLFPPHYWRFSAEAVEPVQAVFLYGTRLRETAEADPAFGYQLMKRAAHIVIERLQDVRQRLIDRR